MRPIYLTLIIIAATVAHAGDPVFSGPQIGEPLQKFAAERLIDDEGEPLDFVGDVDRGPALLVFFHELTRPGFGLTNAITRYSNSKSDKGMKTCVIFLTDDHTKTKAWTKNVTKYLTKGVLYGYSTDGKEGPGIYGLNRNVKLTVLVANKGKVTANFAIGQPQLEVDGPKILKGITEVTGGGETPTIAQLSARSGRGAMQMDLGRKKDPKLATLLRGVINKQASEDEVKTAAKKVEAHIADSEIGKKELTRIVNTVVGSGKLANYGTPAAQEILKAWAKKFPATKTE